jgi:soluble lytic murein transglycosylase-like protein
MRVHIIILCAMLVFFIPSVAHASPSIDGEIQRLAETMLRLRNNANAVLETIKDEEMQKENDNSVRAYIADYSIKIGKISREDADEYGRVIVEKAKKYDFDPFLITAMVQTESTFNRHAVGSSKDTGPMQLIPSTAKGVAKSLGVEYSYKKLFNIEYNIELGCRYLSDNRGYFLKNGSYGYGPTYLAVIGYNRGPGSTLKGAANGNLVESYGKKVYSHYSRIKNGYMK